MERAWSWLLFLADEGDGFPNQDLSHTLIVTDKLQQLPPSTGSGHRSGSGKYSVGKLCYNNFMFNAGSLTFQEFIMSES
ncbi:MAG: hypothetical protein MN733_37610, partial [Nitrososphaera sp.]|nr:hypothetical protein [Nitrososphaera sp.]